MLDNAAIDPAAAEVVTFEPELSNEVYLYIVSKLQRLKHQRGFGRIELKVQDGVVHTMHFTESTRAPKRPKPARTTATR
jgi:hypothetical protein